MIKRHLFHKCIHFISSVALHWLTLEFLSSQESDLIVAESTETHCPELNIIVESNKFKC